MTNIGAVTCTLCGGAGHFPEPCPPLTAPAPRGSSEAETLLNDYVRAHNTGPPHGAVMARAALVAYVAQLAAQRDAMQRRAESAESDWQSAEAQRDEAENKAQRRAIERIDRAAVANDELIASWREKCEAAHAAGYAAAREEAAQAIVPIYDRVGRMEMRPGILDRKAEALMFDVFRCAILAPLAEAQVAIRALPSPASPDQGTPKEGA